MHYKKIKLEGLIIEFQNNWLGEESVIVNGQVVSKKSSIWGADHHFSLLENGSLSRYVLSSKVDGSMAVYLDLKKNRQLVLQDIGVPMNGFGGGGKKTITSSYKAHGLIKLKEYKIEEAIEDFNKALDTNPEDPEVYFHLACAYSIMEKPMEGFECLQKSIDAGLNNKDMILSHDMLAFLRMHDAFEEFQHSGYTKYNKEKLG